MNGTKESERHSSRCRTMKSAEVSVPPINVRSDVGWCDEMRFVRIELRNILGTVAGYREPDESRHCKCRFVSRAHELSSLQSLSVVKLAYSYAKRGASSTPLPDLPLANEW